MPGQGNVAGHGSKAEGGMEERSHERVRLPQDALGLRKGDFLEVVSDGSCEGREAEELVYVK